jgi:prepilin-type N-terminal cleavage/methylation domain-containing protein
MVKSGKFSKLERSVRDERMKRSRNIFFARNRSAQAGLSLIETMIALAILLVVAGGVMGLAGVAVSTTETQGHLAARTAEYAQDKMEQLLALKFCDGITDTTQFPAITNPAGTGLAGCTNLTAPTPTASAGGGLSTSAATKGYVDYLDASGNLVSSTAAWEYVRVWQITVPAGSVGLKQITVLAKANHSAGGNAVVPQSTVVALKTFPF